VTVVLDDRRWISPPPTSDRAGGGFMALNVSLLRESFEVVATANPKFIARFYDILFERYPQTRGLFSPGGAARQAEMLTGALVAVLEHIEDAPWLQDTLGALGAKHVGYGVTREMYDWVGESLLATLAEVAGPAWTKELEAAWAEAYGVIVSLMLARVAA
jgi:hemoglobin-like flavoprotein